MSTRVPPPAASSLDSTVARACPRPRASRPVADSFTVRVASSASSRATSVRNVSEIGPSFTFILAFQWVSSTASVSSAPGMQGTTRGTSSSRSHAASGEAGTSNEFSSFMAAGVLRAAGGLDGVSVVCRHATSSARMATAISSWREEPRSSPAGLRTRPAPPPRARARAARRAPSPLAARSRRARRSGRRRERRGQRAPRRRGPCPPPPPRRRRRRPRPHAPADRRAPAGERARGRALARRPQAAARAGTGSISTSTVPSDAQSSRPTTTSAGASAAAPGGQMRTQPRLAVGQRAQRLARPPPAPSTRRPPSPERAVGRHERPVARGASTRAARTLTTVASA